VTEKAPEQSGQPTLDRFRESGVCGSYGDPVLEWRRPGGSVRAIRGQGSQADLSLPPSCEGVSYSKQSSMAHIRVLDSARKNGLRRNRREPRKAFVRLNYRKCSPVTGDRDGYESLGREVGAQGVLAQPECARGCSIPESAAALRRRVYTNVERLIRCPGRREDEKDSPKVHARKLPCL